MDRPAGTVKPIHRDMRGMVHSMVLLVRSIWSFLGWALLILLVSMLTFMDRKEMTVDTRGRMVRPMLLQLRPLAQNFQVGTLARLMPRKLKSMAKTLEPASPRASFTLWRTAGSFMASAI